MAKYYTGAYMEHIHVCDYDRAREIFTLTGCGRKLETAYYYDRHGRVWPREYITTLSARTLPASFVATYTLGELLIMAKSNTKYLERRKSMLKTALMKGENATADFVLQMLRTNQYHK